MSKIGITRRIDELGRIVIPRDIREHFRVKAGDSFVFSIDNDSIVLKKDSPLEEKLYDLVIMCEVLQEKLDAKVIFYYDGAFIDPERTSSIKDLPIKITTAFETILSEYHPTSFNDEQIFVDTPTTEAGYTYPIVDDGNILGVFVIFKTLSQLSEQEMDAIKLFEQLLVKRV